MANTQTSVPAFVASQVLTAQQQTEINTGIPVFATTVTRDAAFGGAGEKALAEGQFAYIEATNTTQYYDGAAWQSVGGSSGLTFITGATFSNVASVTFPNSTFSSTYSNYLVQLQASAASTSTLTMQFRDNGGTKSTAAYYGAFNQLAYAGTASTVLSNGVTSAGIGSCAVSQGFFTFFVGRPNEAAIFPVVTMTGWAFDKTITGGFIYGVVEAMTGLVISATVNITGLYKVYGLANS